LFQVLLWVLSYGAGTSGSRGGTSGAGGTSDARISSGSGSTGGVDGSTLPPASSLSTITTTTALPAPAVTIPPRIQPLQAISTLSLNIIPAGYVDHTINRGGTMTGTTSNNGTTYTLSALGAMTGTADHPGARIVNGAITNGSTTVYGLYGYMMGLINAARTGAKAFLSIVYIDNSGQADFLMVPLPSRFTSTSFSNQRYINYDADKKAAIYRENLTGAVHASWKEVNISNDFDCPSALYKCSLTMNNFAYYSSSNIYTSISSGTIQLKPMVFADLLPSGTLSCVM
jgi:hypothetical protein